MQTFSDFYQHCDAQHREFYAVLSHEWRQAGQLVRVDDAGVWLSMRSAAAETGHGFGLILLYPGSASAEPALILHLEEWHRIIGAEQTSRFVEQLRAIEGLDIQIQRGQLHLARPAHSSGGCQKRLRDLFLAFAHRLSLDFS